MSSLKTTIISVVHDLDELDVNFALIGGMAVSVMVEPRFTRDVDLAVAVADDRQAEHLIYSLNQKGYQVMAILEQISTHRLATVRLLPPSHLSHSGVVVDLLFASSGIEPEIVEQAERIAVFHGIVLPVATVGHLLAMKILSHHPETRPQDVVDIKNLLTTLTPAEEVRCVQALRLIQARGFHRGRDLEGMLATLRMG